WCGREEKREETPGHSVVEVVDQPRLADAREVAVAQRRPPEDIARAVVVAAEARLERGMRFGVADGHRREEQACRSECNPEVERLRPESVARRDETGRQRGTRNGDVAREFIQPHREPTPRGA